MTIIAQDYCQPTVVVPQYTNRANTQSFYSINVTSNEKNIFSYTDAEAAKPYNWLQDTENFTLTKGSSFSVDIRAGIWSWNIVLGFDWDGDGTFETTYWAFGDKSLPVSVENSSWKVSPYDDADWRKAQQKELGHRGVLQHTFEVNIPSDAKIGKTRMRVLCDGDGYNNGKTPPLDFCENIGYAGSMHDFGVTLVNEAVASPIITPNGAEFTSSQEVTITTSTEDANIFYTLDETTPSVSSIAYTGPITLTSTTVVKAIAIREGFADSEIVSASFVLLGKVVTPKANPPAGKYTGKQMVTLSSTTSEATIYYTLNGNNPSTSSERYTKPIEITESSVLKAIAVKEGEEDSDILTAEYVITWNEPGGSIHPSEGRYITSATTTGAKKNLSFSQNEKPLSPYIHPDSSTEGNAIEVEAGQSFTLNLHSTDPMKWCRAAIYIDWNKDYQFNENDELIARIGNEKQRNDNVLNIMQSITVPESATIGVTRLRIQYTDAWTRNDRPTFNYTADEDIFKGGVYDFDMTILKPSSIDSNTQEVLLMYPSFTKDMVYFKNAESVSIYSTNGILVTSKKGDVQSMNISDLPQGIYFVKIVSQGNITTQKLVKK